MMNVHRKNGQALTDYLLPLGLVCIVGIVSLSLLGGNLSGMFSGAIQKKSSTPPVSMVSTAGNPSSSNLANVPGTQTLEVTLADGSKATISNYPTDLPALIETVGIDGGTDTYAQTLQQLADIYEQKYPNDPDTTARIRQLSNLGFTMGNEYEQVIRATDANNVEAGLSAFGYTRATVEGLLTMNELAEPSGYRFSGLFEELSRSNKIQDPALKNIFKNSGEKIIAIYQQFNEVTSSVIVQSSGSRGNLNPPFKTVSDNFLQTPVNETIGTQIRETRQESSNICTVGQGQTVANITCKPRS